MQNYKFVQNKNCEYFPCHPDIPEEEFNCLFCYCPLYALKGECGGDYTYLSNGIKSCMSCIKPHQFTGYDHICSHIDQLLEVVKNKKSAL